MISYVFSEWKILILLEVGSMFKEISDTGYAGEKGLLHKCGQK